MTSYEESKVKLTNTKLIKLKSAGKDKTRKTLRITAKHFQNGKLPSFKNYF